MENTEAKIYSFEGLDGVSFKVALDDYAGPIDLLLHLVKTNELEIEKISLAKVCEQYIACMEEMQKLDLEIAGEYLVIAATLLSIKSAVLLNDPVEMVLDGQGKLVDPHEELLKKLREAAIYKEGAQQLSAIDCLGIDVFAPPAKLRSFKPEPAGFADHDPMLLGRAFKRVLSQLDARGLKYVVSFEPISIVETMISVMSRFKFSKNQPLEFEALLGDKKTVSNVVATSLALLELCKRSAITIKQGEAYDQIIIAIAEDLDEASLNSTLSSEFDGNSLVESAVANMN